MRSGSESQIEASIIFLSGPLAGQEFQLTQPITTLGRHSSNNIPVPDPNVSRHHARILWSKADGTWRIEKVSQSSYITVAQQQVEQAILPDEVTIRLGNNSSFCFRCVPDDATQIVDKASYASSTLAASISEVGLPTLEVTNHTNGIKEKYLLAKAQLDIGRNPTNDIVIDDPLVSDRHLRIERQQDQWLLVYPHPEQVEIHNSLIFQGRKIRGKRTFRKLLTQGDIFRIVDEQGNMVTLTYHDGKKVASVALPPVQPIPLASQDRTPLTIGRVPDNVLVLNHPQVSAHHARLTREAGGHRLTDLNSSNHTYVNGMRVSSLLLQPHDEIRVGPFKLIYTGQELRQSDESESIDISVLDLKKTGNKQAVLLNDISLHIPPRSFVALVGSSGTGKSTLLDALSGLRPAHEGSVLYNGENYYQNLAAFRSQLGYVPQEDIMHRDLTVERALYYAAKLRLPADFINSQIEQRITEVLEDVEMTPRRTLLIKKLSGGQRKRISIALELLAKPSVFFLDEPTSGLDPGLDRKMMILLRRLADKGHTVVLVTHATNNINICDSVCFLAQGGRLAYFGPPEEAKTYFQQPDFAEIYNFLEPSDERPTIHQEAEERFKQSSLYQQAIAEPLTRMAVSTKQSNQASNKRVQTRKKRNPWKQFSILSLRYLELLWNDKWNLAILLLQAPIIGLIVSVLVHSLNETAIFKPPIDPAKIGDAQRFMFILSFSAVMFGCINASRELIKEEHIYRRERAVNLGILPYLLSKILILSMLCLIQCAILIIIMSMTTPFYAGIILPEFWEVYIILALSAIAGVMIGLTMSALVRNNDQAMSFIPLVLIPQVVFSGSMFPLKGIPLQLFGMLFSLRWAMAGLGSSLNLFSYDDKIFGTCASCNSYQHNANHLLLTWLALGVTILALGILSGYFLKRKDPER
ncbi:ABC transporter ATP-binding protein [Ktedonobacteria bacterium brp13]|nr:ABC transporter ATP-binding protein [Ktedonobacteria bacterium brp13]